MTEYTLKYGCNPNQNPARIHMDGKELPFEILTAVRVTSIFWTHSILGSL